MGDSRLTYTVSHEAHYWPSVAWASDGPYEVMIHTDRYEFAVRWHEFSDGAVPRLEMFSEAFSALREHPAFFKLLAEMPEHFEPRALVRILEAAGATDVTARSEPQR